MLKIKQALAIPLLTLSFFSQAHPGHDHSDPMSMLIHLVWIAPAFVAAGLFISKRKKSSINQQKQKND